MTIILCKLNYTEFLYSIPPFNIPSVVRAFNYALAETIRLMETLFGLSDEEIESLFSELDRSVLLTEDVKTFVRQEHLPPLAEKIFSLWQTRIAWRGREDLGAEIALAVSSNEENALLETIADFLWANRQLNRTREDQDAEAS